MKLGERTKSSPCGRHKSRAALEIARHPRPAARLELLTERLLNISTTKQLTTTFSDVQATTNLFGFSQPGFGQAGEPFGARIGLAAVGNGTAGQSHAYVGFTSNSVSGIYSGVDSPDINNHLTRLEY